jgi:uncharacterized protein involved in exopolysaccharide biosynthesis
VQRLANQTDAEDEELMDLRALVAQMWAGKYRIMACAGVVALGFGVVAFLTTPVYRATTVLVSASADRSGLGGALSSTLDSLGGLASLAGVGLGSNDAAVEEALAVLRSRDFTERFIVEQDLLPKLFPDKWDPVKKAWTVPEDRRPTLARAFRKFDEGVRTVNRDRKTSLITMTIDWPDRSAGAEIANAMVAKVNAEMRGRAIDQADRSLGFLQQELATTGVVDTRAAINRLIEAQIKQRMLANVTQEYSFRVVDRALTPDLTDKVRPKRLQMILVGLLLGGALGALWVYLRPAKVPKAAG